MAWIPIVEGTWGTWRLSLSRAAYRPEQLAARYARRASSWTRSVSRLGYPEAYARILAPLASDAALGGEAPRVLDCGTGTGTLCEALLAARSGPVDLHLCDLAPQMLAVAAGRVPGARLVRADIRALPYADGRFDMVMAAHVLEHLPDPRAGLLEMARVTRAGGRVLVIATRRGALGTLLAASWRVHGFTGPDLAGLLEDVGLQVDRVAPLGRGVTGRMSLGVVAHKAAAVSP